MENINGQNILSYNTKIKSVPSKLLSDEDKLLNKDAFTFVNRGNSRYDKMIKMDKEIVGGLTPSAKLAYDSKVLGKFAGGVGAIETGIAQDDPGFPNLASEVTPLTTDVTTSNDYTKIYGPSYQNAGYNGPMTLDGFTQAGFYGGDPYSIRQLINTNRVIQPSPTIPLS